MATTNKYNYYRVIQQNYGQGWEDVSLYPTKSDYISTEGSGVFYTTKSGKQRERRLIVYDLEQYRTLGYPTRVISRKVLTVNDK